MNHVLVQDLLLECHTSHERVALIPCIAGRRWSVLPVCFPMEGEELPQTRQLSTFDSLKWWKELSASEHIEFVARLFLSAGNLSTSGANVYDCGILAGKASRKSAVQRFPRVCCEFMEVFRVEWCEGVEHTDL